MSAKLLRAIAKIIGVWLALVLSYIAGTLLSGLAQQPVALPAGIAGLSADTRKLILTLLIVCFLISLVISYILLRSRGHGWKLVAALFLAMFGIMTVLSQIESVIYLRDRMPPGLMAKLFGMGAIAAAIFAPLAVLIVGKMGAHEEDTGREPLSRMTPGRFVGLLLLTGAVYLALYMGFGYYVAWRNPAVQQYYGGTNAGSFLAQMKSIWHATPWMFPLQAGRGVLWALFVLPLIRLLRRSPIETAFAMALFCGVWSSILLFPNPLMPEAVARTHLVETLWSNLIFGAFLGYFFAARPEPFTSLPTLMRP